MSPPLPTPTETAAGHNAAYLLGRCIGAVICRAHKP